MEDNLTPKQQRFVEEYMVDSNKTQAAVRAGYSAKSAPQQGAALYKNAKVQKAIRERRKGISAKTGLSAEYVDHALMKVAESGLQKIKLLDGDGQEVLDADGEPVWVLVNPKAVLGACEQMGKRLGLFKDKLELAGELDLAALEAGRRRAYGG